jgi:hypothetical protein
MKLIERSCITGEIKNPDFLDRIQGIVKYGLAWENDRQAQNMLIHFLQQSLDSKHTLIRNIPLAGSTMPLPITLLSPSGLRLMYPTGVKGIFRIKGDAWYLLQEKKDIYASYRPNLIRRTILMARGLANQLHKHGFPFIETEAIMFFSHPGIHIDAEDPSVQIVQADGVVHFIQEILEGQSILSDAEIEQIVDYLSKTKAEKTSPKQSQKGEQKKAEQIGFGEFRMLPWQWAVVGLLAIVALIIIAICAYIFSMTI